jgi:hypothetical protein
LNRLNRLNHEPEVTPVQPPVRFLKHWYKIWKMITSAPGALVKDTYYSKNVLEIVLSQFIYKILKVMFSMQNLPFLYP